MPRQLISEHALPGAGQHLVVEVDDGAAAEKSVSVSVSEPKFRIRNLTKLGGDTTTEPILSGVCMEVEKGQTVGIIGPSGSGKSTLLRALNRLWEPEAGTVFLEGEDVCDMDVVQLRRRVGMLFQVPVLFQVAR
ncbi:hypothetical protein ACLOJK_036865 [Asimina triloba]